VARHAVLIQDGTDVAAEAHFVAGAMPNEIRDNERETGREKPEHPKSG
jgi:hypothetical protein